MKQRSGLRPKIASNNSSKSSSKLCSLKTTFKILSVIIIALLVVSSHLFSVISTHYEDVKSGITTSHGIHASIREHKSNLALHLNQKANLDDKQESLTEVIQKNSESPKVGRRVPQLPMSQTPALVGASKGRIQCDADVDSLVYWNDPQGTRDIAHVSPFVGENPSDETKYLTFEADSGGWNNIRMSLEIVIIFAAVSGRTLVMPPDAPLYLLWKDKKRKTRGFADFFPIHSPAFLEKVSIISTKEFIARVGHENGPFPIPKENRTVVEAAASTCVYRKKAENSCFTLHHYLSTVGFVPDIDQNHCVVFDEDVFHGEKIASSKIQSMNDFCKNSEVTYFSKELHEKPIIHFQSRKQHRLLAHFYGFMYFTDPALSNYYKRFVRDHLHYHDQIYCAAGKIVNALQELGQKQGFTVDSSGGGGFSTMHVRRGDLQYKRVKISAEEWYDNLHEVWSENEIIYIATDEKDKSFFDPIAKHHKLYFLDDFKELAELDKLDTNYFGMIDTIVASRGRTFSGTYFSTFTGYINRMRGYHGMSMKDSYYGWKPSKTKLHEWTDSVDPKTFAYEWPSGWVGIDGDMIPDRNEF